MRLLLAGGGPEGAQVVLPWVVEADEEVVTWVKVAVEAGRFIPALVRSIVSIVRSPSWPKIRNQSFRSLRTRATDKESQHEQG